MSERVCQCPCRGPLPADARANRRYVDERHKERARRERLTAALKAAGLPTVLTMKAARATTPARNRGNPAPARARRRESRPRPGVQVYFQSMEVAQAVLDRLGPDEQAARDAISKAIERRKRRG